MMQEEQLIQVADGQLKQDSVIRQRYSSNMEKRITDQLLRLCAAIADLALIRCERLAAAWPR